ncbi:DUF3883 domain-containing protein [Clostridium estertheticum]|uniref:DUF3883 domain-containing protein n=1 Tax=Clostridium estertheticum TaxID=238834 RepID=UPI001C7E0075|nr:DUF3883 domain-containing protein [Clostridium estertheticum]MBX4272191.1 DUF3883 domain-containing protein [Clostridium estertheticum]WLC78878.1 DUF3883 domain-containing protein [Clostridium estertheticum]
MIRDVIIEVNKRFINEAKNSPQLFEDLAQLEHYIAESYGSRVLIELLQNADDAVSTKVYLYYDGINLYFANNGRPFNEDDIISISRSGSSNKSRKESIGYRGVGFKSTTFLTNDIVIYSNDVYFTFSMQKTKELLNDYGISKCPTVRIPFLIDEDLDYNIRDTVNELSKEYSTIFVFKNPEINLLKDELNNFQNDVFIFLNNINEFTVSLDSIKKHIEIFKDDSYVVIQNNEEKSIWKVYKGETKKAPFQIAFRFDGEKLIPCSNKESVLHVYLPTLDKLGFPFKINGYFSTDPSRKHVNFDEDCKEILNASAELVVNMIKKIFDESKEDTSILQIIITNNSLSKFSMYFEESVYGLIKSLPIVKTKAGKFKCISDIMKPPKFLTLQEFNNLIDNCSHLKDKVPANRIDTSMNNFLERFTGNSLSLEDLINVFSINSLNDSVLPGILGKMFANLINEVAQQKYSKLNLDCLVLPDKKGIISKSYSSINDNKEIQKEFIIGLNENIYKGAMDYFDNTYHANIGLLIKTSSVQNSSLNENDIVCIDDNANENILYRTNLRNLDNSAQISNVKNTGNIVLNISKWRSAELQCVEIEKYLFGNEAKDVSKQNKGYDTESIDKNGNLRYIEVKSLKGESDCFTMTNNEYTTAHMYGEKYFMCLMINQNSKIKVIYIKDPVKNLNMDKRIKQWEWFCDEYKGEEFTIAIES